MESSSNRPNVLLFDLDGTLLDTAPDLAAALNHARTTVLSLPPVAAHDLKKVVTKGTRAMIEYDVSMSLNEDELSNLRSSMLDYYREHIAEHTAFFPGILEILDTLDQRAQRWGVITNKLSEFTLPLLDAMALTERAGCVLCADMVDSPKPAPDSLLEAAAKLNCTPTQCAYIGDALTDMHAAHNAGMLAVAAEWGYISSDDPVDRWPYHERFATPDQLLEWIKN
ncbi:MAG: HAD family hydrolase [Gammaproteobacteria bacterium]